MIGLRFYRGPVPWCLAILWMAVIFWFSAQPGQRLSAWNAWGLPDFSGHLTLYAVLGLLYFGAFRRSGHPVERAAWASLGLALLYGISDEIHQIWVPGRSPTAVDVVWDALGAGAAVVGAVLWNRCLARRRPSRHPVLGTKS